MRTPLVALTVLALTATVSPAVADPDPSLLSQSPTATSSQTPTATESTTSASPTTPSDSPSATPSGTPTPGPYGIPMKQNIREDAWCRLLIPNHKGDAAEADSIMDDNTVDLGQYGTYHLTRNPDWKPQRTLDSSGNDHVNGLYWATPLLYTGARRGDDRMVGRFFDLIGDWLGKHKKKKTRTWSVTQPIIAGERLWTLTCASDISDGARFVKATRKEAKTQLKAFRLGGGTNNTSIHSQGSALAAFCYLGDTARRDKAANNLNRLADYLILPDGSDREGSPWYAYYTLRLLENLAPVFDRCGVSYDRIYSATKRMDHFLATAVDPNFYLAMRGDTHRARLGPKWFAPDSEARWAATQGAEGQPPSKLYEVFSGGYAFGRNSWTDVDGHRPSFYSVRVSRPYVTAHVHSDLGSVTFNSYGSEFVGDPGPYRYDNSAIRNYIVSRSGHSVIRVTEKKPKKKKKSKKSAAVRVPTAQRKRVAADGAYDRTCVRDRTYVAARIKRCVYYDAGIDALVVVDKIKAKKRIKIDQRWQIPNGVKVATYKRGAKLTAATAAARMRFTGGGKVRKYRPNGRRPDGWFTAGYGELVKGTVVQRSAVVAKGRKRTWVTVVAAGNSRPKISIANGTVSVTRDTTTGFTLP
ncbi:MAG: heparinase II/III family protein [Candidatus Nanopelagicales bacterium]